MSEDTGAPPEEGFLSRNLPELFRKMAVASLGAVFMTEEGIRSLVKDLKLPKEILGSLVSQADRTKGDLVRVMGQEMRAFLQSAKVREDLVETLQQLTFEVKAEIKVKPRGEGQPLFQPEVTARLERPRRRRKRKS
jgi:hypothetical protein